MEIFRKKKVLFSFILHFRVGVMVSYILEMILIDFCEHFLFIFLFYPIDSIKDIKEIRAGKNSEIMRNRDISLSSSEECVFSISIGDDFNTLDLIAPSPEDANIWVTGLNFLIGANKCKLPLKLNC